MTIDFSPRSLPMLYARGVALRVRRSQGRFPAGSPGFPGLIVEQRGVHVDRARIEAWQAVCGETAPSGTVPPCLPEALFLGPMGRLVTDATFPLSPLGLIHVGQRIVSHSALSADESLDLRCRIEKRD